MKKEIQEIEDLANVIRHANDQDCECKCEACFNCTAGNMANAVYKAGYRKDNGLIAENERLLTEIKEIEKARDIEYDTVYEQAEATLRSEIADGGTSCHWCIDSTKKATAKEFGNKIAKAIYEMAGGLGIEGLPLATILTCIADLMKDYGVKGKNEIAEFYGINEDGGSDGR